MQTDDVRRRGVWWGARAAVVLACCRVLLAGHELSYDSKEYLRGARALLGDGDYSTVRYPPGFPVLLAVADVLRIPAWWVTTMSGVVLVATIWWIADRLGGDVAGIFAAVLCAVSPLVGEAGVDLMADTPAAALAILAVLAAVHDRWTIAGALVAASSWVRIAHFSFAVGLLQHRRAALIALLGVVPLAAFNIVVFGSLSTYAPNQIGWSVAAFTEGISLDGFPAEQPNWIYYPSVLVGRWGFLVPGLPLLAGLELWRRRGEPATYFSIAIIVSNLAVYALYYFQSPRFVLPTAALLVVYSSAWAGRVAELGTTRWWSGHQTDEARTMTSPVPRTPS